MSFGSVLILIGGRNARILFMNDSKKTVTVVGLGRIGSSIARQLQNSGQYHVIAVDANPKVAQQRSTEFHAHHATHTELKPFLEKSDAVFSAVTFNENPVIAQTALETGCSYFDLTEDVACTKAIQDIAKRAQPGQLFMPQCGLAPGFIGILANSFVGQFDQLDSLQLRVGALPAFGSNQMMYNLTWSTDGLINEYANPCEAIKHGKFTHVEPLEGRELFSLAGVEYEAFNTSGGLGTLCHTLEGKVRELSYKTVRYPGHCELMRFLFRDLRLGEVGKRRDILKEILETSVAVTKQDRIVLAVIAQGQVGGVLEQRSRTFVVPHTSEDSAIQIATSAGALSAMDLALTGKIGLSGFVGQEQVNLDAFLNNEFAAPYRNAEVGRYE